MKIAVVIGTRPEIIKMSPIIRECEKKELDYFILHTGQHYSYEMDNIFFEELKLQQPKYNLNIGSGTHAEQTGKMLVGIENILKIERPNIVLVVGDTNTVLAGSLAATKIFIKVGHVESGLRSYDRLMPEETNRILTDHISDYLFVPTESAKQNLEQDGIDKNIFIVGNTIVDAVFQNLEMIGLKRDILDILNISAKNYFLATVHRQENVDNEKRLKNILDGLELISQEYNLPMIFPVHPRTKKKIDEFNLKLTNIKTIAPIGYLEFLKLESNARLIISDSGGIQEEACILKVPCITLRYNTERPETIDVGSNILVGTEPGKILDGAKKMLKGKSWNNPFGDGTAGERILKIIENEVG